MQLLIQDIFSKIIDSSLDFPERFCDISCMNFPFKTKQKVLSHVNIFLSEIYKKFECHIDAAEQKALNFESLVSN
jgi:hypothetical protein